MPHRSINIKFRQTKGVSQPAHTAKDFYHDKRNRLHSDIKRRNGFFPVDTPAMDRTFKSTAALNEKLSTVALSAAEKSSAVSSKWATDTFAKMSDINKIKAEPADFAKAIKDFASGAVEATAEHMATFAEIAKKFQAETVELMRAAGKNMSEEAQSVAKKATADVTAATRKVSTK